MYIKQRANRVLRRTHCVDGSFLSLSLFLRRTTVNAHKNCGGYNGERLPRIRGRKKKEVFALLRRKRDTSAGAVKQNANRDLSFSLCSSSFSRFFFSLFLRTLSSRIRVCSSRQSARCAVEADTINSRSRTHNAPFIVVIIDERMEEEEGASRTRTRTTTTTTTIESLERDVEVRRRRRNFLSRFRIGKRSLALSLALSLLNADAPLPSPSLSLSLRR